MRSDIKCDVVSGFKYRVLFRAVWIKIPWGSRELDNNQTFLWYHYVICFTAAISEHFILLIASLQVYG